MFPPAAGRAAAGCALSRTQHLRQDMFVDNKIVARKYIKQSKRGYRLLLLLAAAQTFIYTHRARDNFFACNVDTAMCVAPRKS